MGEYRAQDIPVQVHLNDIGVIQIEVKSTPLPGPTQKMCIRDVELGIYRSGFTCVYIL